MYGRADLSRTVWLVVALSLTAEGTHHDGVTEFVGFGISLDFLSGSPVVARAVHASQIKVYRHGDL